MAQCNRYNLIYYVVNIFFLYIISIMKYNQLNIKLSLLLIAVVYIFKIIYTKTKTYVLLVLDLILAVYFIFYTNMIFTNNTFLRTISKPFENIMFDKGSHFLVQIQLFLVIMLIHSTVEFLKIKK